MENLKTHLTQDQIDFLTLSIFAGGEKCHWYKIIYFGVILTHIPQRRFEKLFKRVLEYNWVDRLNESPYPEMDFYRLSDKGDLLFRLMQICRGGDPEFYTKFNRTAKAV